MGFQHVSDLCVKVAMWHLTADEVIHVLRDIRGDGVENKEETCLRMLLSLTQPVSVVVTVTVQVRRKC